jgi:hypothetical protein
MDALRPLYHDFITSQTPYTPHESITERAFVPVKIRRMGRCGVSES